MASCSCEQCVSGSTRASGEGDRAPPATRTRAPNFNHQVRSPAPSVRSCQNGRGSAKGGPAGVIRASILSSSCRAESDPSSRRGRLGSWPLRFPGLAAIEKTALLVANSGEPHYRGVLAYPAFFCHADYLLVGEQALLSSILILLREP